MGAAEDGVWWERVESEGVKEEDKMSLVMGLCEVGLYEVEEDGVVEGKYMSFVVVVVVAAEMDAIFRWQKALLGVE